MSAVRGSCFVDLAQRRTMALASGKPGELEYGLQTLCALVRARGVGDMHQHFANDPDMEQILLDSTIVRAHPCAAGASKKAVGKKAKRSDAAGAGSAPRSTPV
jgi:hypothetical protein